MFRTSSAPSLAWSYALLAPAMIFIVTAMDRGYQTDLWHHLARGREMVRSGSILNRDVFTYTVPGQPIVDNNWLTQSLAWRLYDLGGLNLLQTVNSLLLGITLAIAVGVGVRLGASIRVAALVGVAMIVGLSHTLLIRPQTVSMLLFISLLATLIAATRRPIWLILPPMLLAVWANVHGAFPIGLVLTGCFTLAESRGQHRVRWIIALLASALATCLNPYAWNVYGYVLQTSSRASNRVIEEWLRPNVFTFAGGFWLASIIGVLALAIVRRRRAKPWMWVTLVVFAIISATSVRMGIWWVLLAGPIAMGLLGFSREGASDVPRSRPIPALLLFGAIVGMVVLSLPAMERFNPVFRFRSPERLESQLQSLASSIPGHTRVFARLEWGEYLSFALPWQASVFMDGRIEIYPDSLWDEYRQITSAEAGWQALLDRRQVGALLLDRHYHDGLIQAVARSPLWREVGRSERAILFVGWDMHATQRH